MRVIYLLFLPIIWFSCKTTLIVNSKWIKQLEVNCDLILEQKNDSVWIATSKELLGKFSVNSIFLEPELFKYGNNNFFVIRQMTTDSVFVSDDILVKYDSGCFCKQIEISYSPIERFIDNSQGEYTIRGKERIYKDDEIVEILKIWKQNSSKCCPAQTEKLEYDIYKFRDSNGVRLKMGSDDFLTNESELKKLRKTGNKR